LHWHYCHFFANHRAAIGFQVEMLPSVLDERCLLTNRRDTLLTLLALCAAPRADRVIE